MKLVQVTVGSLMPNPYRNIDEYPIHRRKVEALKESVDETGFWGTIVARPKGKKYEIAFGHHRLVALQETMGPRAKIQIIVDDLENEGMLKMMIRENLEEWGSDAWVEMEAVKQTIEAFDHGEIELPEMEGRKKSAVDWLVCPTSDKQYSKVQIARFCGMMKKNDANPTYAFDRAWEALRATGYLHKPDEKVPVLVTPATVKKLSREEAAVVVANATKTYNASKRAAKAAEKHGDEAAAKQIMETAVKEARTIGKESARALRDGEGVREVRKLKAPGVATNPKTVDIDGLCMEVMKEINRIFDSESRIVERLAMVRKYRREASTESINDVQKCLDKLQSRITRQKVRK